MGGFTMTNTKAGGPSSEAGKQKVSQNAVKHGATATRLLTPEQKQRYESLLEALQQQYQKKNPLIKLQLERIARLTVQLERIQTVMDATFQKSRIHADVIDNVMNLLELDDDQKQLVAQITAESNTSARLHNQTHSALENEFFTHQLENLEFYNHEDILKNMPYLCTALFKKSTQLRATIKRFIDENLCDRDHKTKVINTSLDDLDLNTDPDTQAAIAKAIRATELKKLILAIDYYLPEYHSTLKSKVNAEKLRKLMASEGQSIMPDLDQLDKLMRYQTTLQRQLSTCIGELLALNKHS
jgi:hypothetical protein